MANKKAHIVAFDDSPLTLTSPIESSEYNQIINSLKSSTLRAINRSRIITDKQTRYNQALVAENTYLSSKISKLQMFSNTLAGITDGTTTTGSALITGYDPTYASVVDTTNVNKLMGQVTVKADVGKKWSKTPRYIDANGDRLPSKDVYITLDGQPMAQSHSIYSILDGSKNSFWIQQLTANTAHSIVIQYPTSIRPFVNSLNITPFPAFGFRLDSVNVTAANGSSINVLPYAVQQELMSGLETHFKPTSWGGTVTINFTTGDTGLVGISDFDIFLIDYVESAAEVTYEIPSFQAKNFTGIANIAVPGGGFEMVGSNEDDAFNIRDSLTITGYAGTPSAATAFDILPGTINSHLADGVSQNTIGFSCPANTKFYLKFAFNKYRGQTPIFRAAKVSLPE